MGVETEDRQKKIWRWKVVFLSLGLILSLSVVFFFIMLKGVILGSFSFVVGFWNSLSSSPLYIYMIINSMVLLIALLSKSHHPQLQSQTTENSPTSTLYQCIDDDYMEADQVSSDKQLDEDEDEDDTMDATWKAISGNKLTKSETFIQKEAPAFASASWKDLKKSETFNEALSIRRRGGMMRRDHSVGIDEFNHKVEAFIKKFNDDIKLQRQQSDQRFIDMINTGL